MTGWDQSAAAFDAARTAADAASADARAALGRALEDARAEGLSIRDAAARLGVPKSTVARRWSAAQAGRVFFRDVKPYFVPAGWDQLRGPDHGTIELPHDVRWQHDRTVDLETAGGRRLAYKALLEEGTADQQAELLNARLLLELWNDLVLPPRVRSLWEDRFPQLRTAA